MIVSGLRQLLLNTFVDPNAAIVSQLLLSISNVESHSLLHIGTAAAKNS